MAAGLAWMHLQFKKIPVDEVLTPSESVGEEETLLAQSAKPLNGPPLLSLKYLREQRRRGCELSVLLG